MKQIDCDGHYYGSRIYNCWNEDYRRDKCVHCSHNKGCTDKDAKDNYITYKEKIDILYRFLMGDIPEGVICKAPKLSPKKAFTVIWFLQEVICCLPDSIEQCDGCKNLFDSESEGYCLDDQYILNGRTLPKKYWGHWCDSCRPNVDFELE